MDPITHGLLGAAASQVVLRRRIDGPLTLAGAIGGMAPDLDFLIRSSSDPLLSLEFHRHFTHSLFFIPFGGLFVTILLFAFYRKKYSFGWVYWAITVGWATHSLLDACTAYGTLLLWPFSRERIAWNFVSILDPVVTILLGVGVVWSLRKHRSLPAAMALTLSIFYMGFGAWQHARVSALQAELAVERGHPIERRFIQPSVFNLMVWRGIYQSGDRYYVDAFRVLPWKKAQYWEGGSLPHYDKISEQPPIPPGSRLEKDIRRFEWFSDGYLSPLAEDPRVIGDIRYSTEANGLKPIWGIRFDSGKPEVSVQKVRFGFRPKPAWRALWEMVLGNFPGARGIGVNTLKPVKS